MSKYSIAIGGLVFIFLVLSYRAFELVYHSPIPFPYIPEQNAKPRGAIFDSNEHELAVSLDSFSVAIRPFEVVNPEQTAFLLASALDMSQQEIYAKLNASARFVWVKRKLGAEQVEELRRLKLPGLLIEKEASRYYPNGRLASTLLGFTGIDNEGLAGLEYQFNDELAGISRENVAGNNLHLTIDAYIQHHLENELRAGMLKTKSKAAVGLIMEVSTGRVLAMTSLPDFDPNDPLSYPEDNLRNRAISEKLEPGSTFKIFTLVSLMKDNLLDPERSYYCPGHFDYQGNSVKCSGVHHEQSMVQVIQNSCNTGIIEASWEMPVNRLYENLKYFGFGSSTNIALPGEERGYLPMPAKWDVFLKMTIPIGQGVSVTPIQLATAANSIANGGTLMRPALVERVTTPEGGLVYEFEPEKVFQSTTPEIGDIILSYLQEVVTSGGTGSLAAIPDFPVAGKTSTANISTSEGYLAGKYQASFLGFFPGDQPDISVYLWFDEPGGDDYQGGKVAAPVFSALIQKIIPVIHKGKTRKTGGLIAEPSPLPPRDSGVMPDYRGLSKKEVLTHVWRLYPGNHIIIGRGYVSGQNPLPGTPLPSDGDYRFQLYFNEPLPPPSR